MLFDRLGKNAFIDGDGKLLLNCMENLDRLTVFSPIIRFMCHCIVYSGRERRDAAYPPEAFKDKVIIVGSNAEGLLDLKATPFSSTDDPFPGMEIHATAIENFLANDFLRRMPPWVVISLMTAGNVLMFGSFKLLKNLRLFIVTFAVCLVAEIAAAYWLLTENIG